MPRILIVDDDAAQLALLGRLVEAGGYQLSLAFGVSEALRQLAAADAVVLDLRLPNAQGSADAAEGLRLIRSIRESGSRAPVIVMSGWPEDLDGTAEAQLISRVLVKPVGIRALLGTLAELVVEGGRAADAV